MSSREWTGPALLGAVLLALLVATGAGARPLLTVSFTSAPPDPSTSTEATFAFSADAQGAAFGCSLDGARATACRSPVTLRGLALGRHTFVVTAVRGSERAFARHEWTIVEPPARTAPLLVMVSGGGGVTSSPVGIACPGRCTQAYPLGAKVTLTARAWEGWRLVGWSGACLGPTSCTVAISGPTFVRAIFGFVGSPNWNFGGGGDQDGDRAANAIDACPRTPPHAKLLTYGCSLLDLLQDGDALLGGLEERSSKALLMTRRISKLEPIAKDLARYVGLLERGAAQLERGDVCGGAATVRRGTNGLRALVRKSGRLVGRMQSQVQKKPSGVGDADVKDLEWAALHYRQGLVEDVAEEATKLRKAFGAACSGLGRKVTFTGMVEKTDDVAGSLELADGTLVQLPTRNYGNSLWEGARVRVAGRRGSDGRVIAESVAALDKTVAQKLAAKPCVSLLIAPTQPFYKPNPILHDPKGYEASGVLWLEERMRIAATPETCADAAGYRYSLAVEAVASGVPKKSIAPDLVAADGPVPLDLSWSSKLWTLTVTLRRQGNNCGPPKASPLARAPAAVAKSYPCPVVPIGTTTYKAGVRPFASYATAVYERTAFDLESNGFAPAKVTGLEGLHDTLSSPGFEGDGYKITGTKSATSFSKIVTNQPFAVWPEFWYGFPWLFPLDSVGVDHFAGLVWPRVVGTRNSKPYRYAARLPRIVTDLLPNCPAGNCFYRLPWKAGGIVGVGQGNGPGISHNGTQLFAFDFSIPDKSTIYATRGGIVGDVVESKTMNFNPCADNNKNGIPGDEEDMKVDGLSNFVRVDHQDGTYSYYAHVDANSVIPAEGAIVERGDPLAKVDNTGRSCGPHLHYQVSIDATNTIYGQTKQICFEGYTFVPLSQYVFSTCFIPKTGNLLISTNS